MKKPTMMQSKRITKMLMQTIIRKKTGKTPKLLGLTEALKIPRKAGYTPFPKKKKPTWGYPPNIIQPTNGGYEYTPDVKKQLEFEEIKELLIIGGVIAAAVFLLWRK